MSRKGKDCRSWVQNSKVRNREKSSTSNKWTSPQKTAEIYARTVSNFADDAIVTTGITKNTMFGIRWPSLEDAGIQYLIVDLDPSKELEELDIFARS